MLQVVAPKEYREALVELAHKELLVGYLEVKKTVQRHRRIFWWPKMPAHVASYIKMCNTCPIVGKPNLASPVAPLVPTSADESLFTGAMIDVVGLNPLRQQGTSTCSRLWTSLTDTLKLFQSYAYTPRL